MDAVDTGSMLAQAELKRRIEAARQLRGLTQAQVNELAAGEGLGLHDLARAERGDIPFTGTHRRTLAHILRVPERWFTEESVDALVGVAEQRDMSSELEQLNQQIAALRDLVLRLALGTLPPPQEPPGTADTGR